MTDLNEKYEAWKTRLVYMARGRRFMDMETGLGRHGNKAAAQVLADMYPDDPLSLWQAQNFLGQRLFHTVEYSEYFPGRGHIVEEGSVVYVNNWRGWNEKKGDVTPFTDMIERLFRSSPKDGKMLMDMLAWRMQNPEPHIGYGVVMSGYESDSSLFCAAIEAAVDPHFSRINNTVLRNPSRSWARDSSICVFVGGDEGLKYSHTREMLMQFIVSPIENRINGGSKNDGSALVPVVNRRFTLVTVPRGSETNVPVHADTYFVVQTEKVGEEISERLRKFLVAGHGKRIMHWLLKRDLSGFVMPRSAPRTMLANVIRSERMKPFERLGKEMLESPINRVAVWVSEALQWAQAVTDKAARDIRVSKSELGRARAIQESLPEVSIRPWYTAEEITLLFPDIEARYGDGTKTAHATANPLDSVNYISRDLRSSGLPLLMAQDSPLGFMVAGRYQYYFVVSDHDKWTEPLTQEQFDAAYRNCPNYRNYVAELTRKAEASRMASSGKKNG